MKEKRILEIKSFQFLAEKVVVSWQDSYGEEGTIDKEVPTKTGNEMWADMESYTLLSFPDYLAGSHQYQLPARWNVSRISIN